MTDIYFFWKMTCVCQVCGAFSLQIFYQTASTEVKHNPQPDPHSTTTAPPLLPPFSQGRRPPASRKDWSAGGKSGQMKCWREVCSADYIPAYEQVLSTVLKDSVKAAVDGVKADWYLCLPCSWSGVALCKNTAGREKKSSGPSYTSSVTLTGRWVTWIQK